MAIVARETTKIPGGMPKFWRGEAKMLPGGYRVLNMPPVGTVIDRGVLVYADTSKLECRLVATVKAVENIDGTTLAVAKGAFVVVGSTLGKATGTTANVMAIDTSNSDKDILTLSATIAGVVAGDILFDKTNEPNAVVGAVFTVEKATRNVIDLAYEANVLKDIAAPVPATWLDGGMCLKNNHSIKYFNQ